MRRAIVVGGSLAGMCAARVLAEVFDEVMVVDRDVFPEGMDGRAGVPQARHAHALLERGRSELDALFPGFSRAMSAAGALSLDAGIHLATHRAMGWQTPGPLGLQQLWSSRDLLEFTVRRLFREQTRPTLCERTRVVGLQTCGRPVSRVTGVVVRTDDGPERAIDADLVVDASGRSTRVEDWLRVAGIPAPPASVVDAHAAYASRLYQAPKPRPRALWWKGLWINAQPPTLPRGGLLVPLEGDRWMVTLSGIAGDAPPTDEAGFVAFMHRLGSPALAHAVSLATPLSEIAGNRSLQNVRRRYDRWERGPRGFIAVGDAACSFNPIYGQGMSMAAANAGLLRAMLRGRSPSEDGFEARFFARQAALVDAAWRLATGADLAWPTTEGERPKPRPVLNAYVVLALNTAHYDPAVRRRVVPIFNLTSSLQTLFRPQLVLRVLCSTLRRKLRERWRGVPPVPDLAPEPPAAGVGASREPASPAPLASAALL